MKSGWVKIPWPGYLDPYLLFVSKSTINTVCYKNCWNISCYHCEKINSVGLNKKISYFFHIHVFRLESGVGVKILRPRYLDPHPPICLLKLNK